MAVNSKDEATFRLGLARGYKEEATQLFEAGIWRACAGSCQLAVENACKAVVALFRPMVRTHEISEHLLHLLQEERFTEEEALNVEALADCAKVLGLKEHILVDYGDELTYKLPWDIYKEEHAQRAMEIANKAVQIAEVFIAS